MNVWPTDLDLICNFPFSEGGGRGIRGGVRVERGGSSRASRAREVRFQTAISRKRLKIILSIRHSGETRSLYRLKVVWKLYEDHVYVQRIRIRITEIACYGKDLD